MRLLSAAILLLFTPLAHADSKNGRADGEAVFRTFGCVQCHGTDLAGTEKGPDLRGVGKTHRFDIYQQVKSGGGGMPAFGDVLDEQQLIHVVEFLKAQTKVPKKPKNAPAQAAAATPAKPKEDPEE